MNIHTHVRNRNTHNSYNTYNNISLSVRRKICMHDLHPHSFSSINLYFIYCVFMHEKE